ncbi:alpha/beta fold hydrolase, partial [Actinoplanes solisilvae]|uniref:alpha/beta fold hydrolase n=1 Tax=Actinoplanes solisilvae TaxID=2486853 RepID=UPI0013E3A246
MKTLAAGTHAMSVDGVDQLCHVHGEGPVCFVHPGGPGIDWTYLRMPELEQFLTVVYLEPVGSGKSGRLKNPDGYTVPTYTRYLAALIEHVAAPSAFVLGHSHGGFVALEYALGRPNGLAGLLLYGTAAHNGADFNDEVDRNAASFPARHRNRPEAKAALSAFEQGGDFDSQFPLYLHDYWRDEEASVRYRKLFDLSPVSSGGYSFDVRADLGRISVPVLALTGRHDHVCGPRWTHELGASIPDATEVVL